MFLLVILSVYVQDDLRHQKIEWSKPKPRNLSNPTPVLTSSHIFAISLPKTAFSTHVNKIITRLLQFLVQVKLPCLQATHADLPVHPARFSSPAITPSCPPIYDTSAFCLYSNGFWYIPSRAVPAALN